MNEEAPPNAKIEKWIKSNKEKFDQEYGPEKGRKILYGTAWKMFNQNESYEIAMRIQDSIVEKRREGAEPEVLRTMEHAYYLAKQGKVNEANSWLSRLNEAKEDEKKEKVDKKEPAKMDSDKPKKKLEDDPSIPKKTEIEINPDAEDVVENIKRFVRRWR